MPEKLTFRAVIENPGNPGALAAFQKLSYTHQRETVQSILDAKRAKTRQDRISKSIEMLRRKTKRERGAASGG